MLFSPIMANRTRRCSAPGAAWCATVSDQASILAISAQIDLDALGFDVFALPSSQLVPLVLLMLRRLGLSEMLGEQKIGEFIHLVRIHYNDAPPYHSFIHAVDVVHFAYLTLRRCPDVLLPLDKLTLIVAALCHDVSAPTPPPPFPPRLQAGWQFPCSPCMLLGLWARFSLSRFLFPSSVVARPNFEAISI